MPGSRRPPPWPPRWCSLRPTKRTRSRADQAVTFINSYCRITKDSVAGRAGELIVLRPWQVSLLRGLLAEGPDGRLRHRAALIGMARKNGKALSLESELPTPTGWTTMGDVAVGDELLDEQGRPCTVVAATEVMFDRPCYRVEFSDGAVIVADADHEWLVHDRFRKRSLVRTTEEMSGAHGTGARYSIPAVGSPVRQVVAVDKVDSVPVRCVEVDSPSHLYLAGPTMIPTHNSALGAGLALEGLFLGPDGGEIYSCAASRDQARIVFGVARRMVELDRELSGIARLYRDAIEHPATGSVYRALSREAGISEGLSPTRTIFDEVHVQPDADLWDVVALAGGAREESQTIGLTTAGARTDAKGQDSHCYSLYQHGCRVVSGETVDPSFFFAWWEPKEGAGADHTDPAVWAEANPGLGDLCSVADFHATLPRTREPEFRTKRTNVWMTSASSALPFGVWDRLAEPDRVVADDCPVIFMADGSWSGDSTGIIAVSVEARPHLWVVDLWENEHHERDWRVPIGDVEDALRRAARTHRTLEVGMDPYRWQRSIQILDNEGLPMLEYPMGSAERMTRAWKTFFDLALDGGFSHSGDPRLARHVDAMVLKVDVRGARPVKDAKMSGRHIDLGVCAVAGVERAAWHAENPTETDESVYEHRGLVTL